MRTNKDSAKPKMHALKRKRRIPHEATTKQQGLTASGNAEQAAGNRTEPTRNTQATRFESSAPLTPRYHIILLLLSYQVSLVAQLIKHLPAMWETWVRSMGWEDPLEKGKATLSSILAWRIPWTV